MYMTIQNIISILGIPTIVVALIYIGKKLQILDTLEVDVKSIRNRFIVIEARVHELDEIKKAQ